MSDDNRLASFNQANLFMQAGRDSSLAGNLKAAHGFFESAAKRFAQSDFDMDARIAKGWAEGSKDTAMKQRHK